MTPTTVEPAPAAGPRPGRQPHDYALLALKGLASLRLTVWLFGFAVALVFFGTLAQMDNGIWTVVDQYFWSYFVWVPSDLIRQFCSVFLDGWVSKTERWGGGFPLPGGKLLGGLMLVNLVAAHLVRFRMTWKRSGVILIHSGLILLFVGEFVTREFAVEQRMTIDEGGSANYAEDSRHVELAFVSPDGDEDKVVVVPQRLLQGGGKVSDPALPVDVQVTKYMANSSLAKAAETKEPNPATAGLFGKMFVAVPKGEESGVSTDSKVDMPAAYVTFFRKGTADSLGTFLVALRFSLQEQQDELTVDGTKYQFGMRFARYYKPYSLELIDFRFDRYLGTEKAKNYSSRVILRDPEQQLERDVTISMNDPLRHRGETFYQSNFDHTTEKTTVLQVVKNPGWLIPYVSCVVVSAGLLLHFGIYFSQFLTRRAAV
ncbi:MAG: cytochrome c biogenesis protein ResB [Gemmataceae bacterium]